MPENREHERFLGDKHTGAGGYMKLTKRMVKYDFFYDRLLDMEREKKRRPGAENDPLLNGQFGNDADFFISEARKIRDFELHGYAES